MVKNTIKKMHGLNVIQSTRVFKSVMWNSGLPGSAVTADSSFHAPGTPYALATDIPQLEPALDGAQVFMKRVTVSTSFTNMSPQKTYFQTIRLRARRNIPATYGASAGFTKQFTTILEFMNQGAVDQDNPFFSPTTGNFFQQNFKILSNKTRTVSPGKVWTVRTKQRFGNRPLTGLQDADYDAYVFKKGQNITFFRAWGINYYDYNEGFSITTPFAIATVDKFYYSFYVMDDVRPNSTLGVNYLPGTRPSTSLDINLPSMTHGEQVKTYQGAQSIFVATNGNSLTVTPGSTVNCNIVGPVGSGSVGSAIRTTDPSGSSVWI